MDFSSTSKELSTYAAHLRGGSILDRLPRGGGVRGEGLKVGTYTYTKHSHTQVGPCTRAACQFQYQKPTGFLAALKCWICRQFVKIVNESLERLLITKAWFLVTLKVFGSDGPSFNPLYAVNIAFKKMFGWKTASSRAKSNFRAAATCRIRKKPDQGEDFFRFKSFFPS